MTDDDTPRGFVPLREYLAQERKIEQLREELEYARWLIGQDVHDELIVKVAGRRLRPYWTSNPTASCGDMRLLLRLVRSYPMAVRNIEKRHQAMVCRLRGAIASAGGDPRLINTLTDIGYSLSKPGIEWLKGWAPELFTPIGEVMRQYAETQSEASAA